MQLKKTFILLLLFVTVLFGARYANAAPGSITLNASTATASPGDQFTVSVSVDLASWANSQNTIKFDNKVLNVISIAAGSRQTFVNDSRTLSEINASGEVRTSTFAFAESAFLGELVNVVFQVVPSAPSGTTTLTSPQFNGTNEAFGWKFTRLDGSTISPDTRSESVSITISDNTPSNTPPLVDAGPDASLRVGQAHTTSATATDDGLPNPPGALSYVWDIMTCDCEVSDVVFAPNNTVLNPTITVNKAATVNLRLAVSDGERSATDELNLIVSDPDGGTPPSVAFDFDQTSFTATPGTKITVPFQITTENFAAEPRPFSHIFVALTQHLINAIFRDL